MPQHSVCWIALLARILYSSVAFMYAKRHLKRAKSIGVHGVHLRHTCISLSGPGSAWITNCKMFFCFSVDLYLASIDPVSIKRKDKRNRTCNNLSPQ